MAIHDVDRSPDRSNPMPNTHDTSYVSGGFPIINQPHKAQGTTSINPVTDASTSAGYVQTKDGRILINDGTNNRIIIGILPDGTQGIVISKAGTNVEDLFS